MPYARGYARRSGRTYVRRYRRRYGRRIRRDNELALLLAAALVLILIGLIASR
jgi:hypothetical protein